MKRIIAAACLTFAVFASLNAQTRKDRLSTHVYWMAADTLKGRSAGTEDAAKVADYIAAQFEDIGLAPFFDDWFQFFDHDGYPDRNFRNVVGMIEGSDPQLKDEYIVIGAHYDHLGVARGKIYNGADDNASGTAAVIELARSLMENGAGLKRTVVFAAFDAEELGLFGSEELAKAIDAEKVKLMMSIDMVGWLEKGKSLSIKGAATIKDGKRILASQAGAAGLEIKPDRFETSILTATDTEGFATRGIPTLAITTGLKSPYHKPEDDAELIDYEGMDKITGYLGGITQEFASDGTLRPSGKLSFKHRKELRPLELGLCAGAGSSSFNFPDASFYGKSGGLYDGGIALQLNMKRLLSFQIRALYESSRCCWPDEGDIFNSKDLYRQKAMTVPAEILVRTGNPSYFFIGAGCWYSHILESSGLEWTGAANQFGPQWSFGMRLFKLECRASFRYGIGDPFCQQNAPEARWRANVFNLTYFF